MPKTFYTERDIIDMAGQGITSLELNDNVVLTDLAREEAHKRGLRLVRASSLPADDPAQAELIHRVKAAVLARLDGQVDAKLLDAVITRVVRELK